MVRCTIFESSSVSWYAVGFGGSGLAARDESGGMDESTPRPRRRLRQRSPKTDTPPLQEIISLDSSSDAFELDSSDRNSDSDSSSTMRSKRVRGASLASKKRGFKRLRRPEGETTQEDTSQEPTPVAEPDEWECVRCTYLNEPQRMACEICSSARALPKQTRKLSAWLATSVSSTTKVSSSSSAKRRAMKSVGRETKTPTMETIDSSDEGESQRSVPLSQSSQRRRHAGRFGESEELWTASSAAQSSTMDELCVQKKKVQEVQAWLQQSVPSRSSVAGQTMKRLVFVCGPPGSGKSTTVRHLTNAMGVDVKEWRDNATAGKLQYHRYLRDEYQLTQVSAWDDFIDFINRSINYSALQVAAVPDTSRSRKTQARSSPTNTQSQSSLTRGQLILLESWPENPFGSLDTAAWEEKLKTAFRQIVNPTANMRYPVVCIFSDVRDKKMDATQLAKIFSDDVVHSPFTSVINFNPVTAAQMKKALLRMLDKMDCTVSPQELQKVIDSSNGDIRHATNMIQLLQRRQPLTRLKRDGERKRKPNTAGVKAVKVAVPEEIEEDEDGASRDPFFSDLHIVGKLLHSKNKTPDAQSASAPSRLLAFDRILDASAISLDRVLSLLHSNCADYFTEIEDLEQAVGLMSLSEMWLHESYRSTSSSTAFKTTHGVVRSLAVRSIALTNEHPAPSAFRPITAPKTYEAAKRMVHCRQDVMRRLQAMPDGGDSSHTYIARGDVYAFEMQPFIDIMNRQRHSNHNLTSFRTAHAHPTTSRADEHALVDDDDIENSDGDGW